MERRCGRLLSISRITAPRPLLAGGVDLAVLWHPILPRVSGRPLPPAAAVQAVSAVTEAVRSRAGLVQAAAAGETGAVGGGGGLLEVLRGPGLRDRLPRAVATTLAAGKAARAAVGQA